MFVTRSGQQNILYRGPYIDASYQVSFSHAVSEKKIFLLEIGQSETRIACGGHVCKRIGTKWTIYIENLT